jgi:hypothetical protein
MKPTSTGTPDRDDARYGMVGLMAVQAFVGYEWFMSGLAKLWRGGFAAGLANELTDTSAGVTGWYRTLLDKTIIPHAWFVGWVVLIAELTIGISLLAAAITWARSGRRLSRTAWRVTLLITATAALAATVLNVAFHLANASPHPWLIPKNGFDEGVDLDSLLPMVQLVLFVVSARLLLRARRVTADTAAPVLDPERL